mgnify:CR=1 FL=1
MQCRPLQTNADAAPTPHRNCPPPNCTVQIPATATPARYRHTTPSSVAPVIAPRPTTPPRRVRQHRLITSHNPSELHTTANRAPASPLAQQPSTKKTRLASRTGSLIGASTRLNPEPPSYRTRTQITTASVSGDASRSTVERTGAAHRWPDVRGWLTSPGCRRSAAERSGSQRDTGPHARGKAWCWLSGAIGFSDSSVGAWPRTRGKPRPGWLQALGGDLRRESRLRQPLRTVEARSATRKVNGLPNAHTGTTFGRISRVPPDRLLLLRNGAPAWSRPRPASSGADGSAHPGLLCGPNAPATTHQWRGARQPLTPAHALPTSDYILRRRTRRARRRPCWRRSGCREGRPAGVARRLCLGHRAPLPIRSSSRRSTPVKAGPVHTTTARDDHRRAHAGLLRHDAAARVPVPHSARPGARRTATIAGNFFQAAFGGSRSSTTST